VLLRAFASPEVRFGEAIDGAQASAVAGALGLVERIGARVPPSTLAADLGREAARELALSRLQVMAKVGGLCDLVPELATAASNASISIVFLKFAALHAGGYVAEGSRAAGDIDVLVRERDVERAVDILAGHGFIAAGTTYAEHHLPPFLDRQGRVVELHTRLPGLREPGSRRFAGFEALERGGGLEPSSGLCDGCYRLRPGLLAAHAIAHGLAHHGGADAYPVSRALADVIDVLPRDRRTIGLESAQWIAEDVPAFELEAVVSLCNALEQGDLDGLVGRSEPRTECALLHHVLASSLDPDYRRSLAIGYVFDWLSDEPRWWRLLKTAQRIALPTRQQLAARLGLANARSVDLRLRWAHTAGLVRRLPELARAARHLMRRQRSR